MLKYEHNEQGTLLEMHGNVVNITAEVTFLIRRVHEELNKSDREIAKVFREMFTKVVTDENSPIWTG